MALKKYILEELETTGVISPQGKVIKYQPTREEIEQGSLDRNSIHNSICAKIVGEVVYPSDTLLKLGYILFGGVRGLSIDKEPTQGQINTLDELGFDHIYDSCGKLHEW